MNAHSFFEFAHTNMPIPAVRAVCLCAVYKRKFEISVYLFRHLSFLLLLPLYRVVAVSLCSFAAVVCFLHKELGQELKRHYFSQWWSGVRAQMADNNDAIAQLQQRQNHNHIRSSFVSWRRSLHAHIITRYCAVPAPPLCSGTVF